MKSDSYPRFLKSALYKTQLVEEMEGRKFPCQLQRSATLMPDMMNLSSARKSDVGPLKSTNDLLMSKEQKHRQSLLPWNRNKKPKKMAGRANTEEISSFFGVESSTESACSTTSTVSAQPMMVTTTTHKPAFGSISRRASEKEKKWKSGANKKSASEDASAGASTKAKPDASSRLSIVHKLSALTLPLHKMRGARLGSRESLAPASVNKPEEVAAAKKPTPLVNCKVRVDYLPPVDYKGDPAATIKDALTALLRSQGILHSSFDCYHLNSDRPLNVESTMTDLNEKEIVVESRVLFRLDFPALVKSLGIKARPNKPFLDILKPLLKRYHFATSEVEGIKLVLEKDASELWASTLGSSVAADFDNDRITVLKIQSDLDIPFVDSEEATPPPANGSTDSRDSRGDSSDATMNSGKGDDSEGNEEDSDGRLSSSPAVGRRSTLDRERLGDSADLTDSHLSSTGKADSLDLSADSPSDSRRKSFLNGSQRDPSEDSTVEPLSPSLRRGAKVTSV